MKKIIELAEKVCHTNRSHTSIDAPLFSSKIWELDRAIRERKALEQTPITEDWLKEHGWEFDYTIEEAVADYHYVTCNGYIKKGEGYLLDWCNGTLKVINDFTDSEFTKYDATLADLYDAIELCEINLED